jgi:hypothetical protein
MWGAAHITSLYIPTAAAAAVGAARAVAPLQCLLLLMRPLLLLLQLQPGCFDSFCVCWQQWQMHWR